MKTRKVFKFLVLASLLGGAVIAPFGSGPNDSGGRPPVVFKTH